MSAKNSRRQFDGKLFTLTAVLIFSSLFLMGQFARTVKKTDDDQFWEFTAMFSEIYKEIRERYVEPVDAKKLFEGALQGMFLTLDPHSQYMDPDNYNQLEKDTEGAFSGIGIHITLKDGVLTVIAPIPGSPSAKAGIKPWDRIIEIDGKKTEGITLIDAVKKLTGPAGTQVSIKVYREGETDFLPFTLTRKEVKVESVYYQMLPETNIGYARISKFSDNTGRDLRKAIESFKEKGAKGIIVDLRYNSGGLLKEAKEVSNLFLPKGKLIVSTKGRLKSQNQEMRADEEPATDLPVLILINRGSASASEILAGAIKDHKRGYIVGIKGQRSFGKGSVQTIQEISHSFEKDEHGNYRPAAIRLTTAKYYTPSGVSIDKVGVTPDIAVELPKGLELELQKHGMYGDPAPEEDDETTSKSSFTWKKHDDKTSGPASQGKPEAGKDKEAVQPQAQNESDNEETEEMAEEDSQPKVKDEKTTGEQPRRIIALDRKLFPDAEIEGEPKKVEPKKKKAGKEKFVDYQLQVATRLMKEHLESGKDFLAQEPEPAKDGKQAASDSKPGADAKKKSE